MYDFIFLIEGINDSESFYNLNKLVFNDFKQ